MQTYSPDQVQLLLGDYIVHGFNEISVQWGNKSFEIVKGIRGKNTRRFNPDRSCIISVAISQASSSNDVFSEIVNQDSVFGTGKINVQLKDISGTTLINSSFAFIESYPDFTFTNKINDRVWNIVCLNINTPIIGGNAKPNSILDNILSII